MSLRTEYDVWYDKHHSLDPSYDDTSSPWYQWVTESIGNVAGLRTLEVACGRGGFVRKLSHTALLACGVDFSFSAVSIAHQREQALDSVAEAGFIQGDAQALPFADGLFDVVISCETIEHLPDQLGGIREFYRVTRSGGSLFLTTPNYFNLMGLYEIYAKFRHPGRKLDQPFDRIQIFPQTRTLLKTAGWKILKSDGTVHQLPIFPGRNPVRLESLEAIRQIKKLLSIFALHYCLICTKEKN